MQIAEAAVVGFVDDVVVIVFEGIGEGYDAIVCNLHEMTPVEQ
jgi:hypothetical protein